MRTFLLVCLAQYVSMMGSHLTTFGLGVWLYQRTGSTTINGWVALATLAPALLASPIAGTLVDRWSPRTGMLVGHAGAGACLLLIAILYGLDMPELWSILLLLTVASAFTALQFPAQSVAMTLLVPREQHGPRGALPPAASARGGTARRHPAPPHAARGGARHGGIGRLNPRPTWGPRA